MILQNLADSITFIPDETNFWFVRTMSGDFFEDYLTNGFIAFGYNEISHNSVQESFRSFPGDDHKDREQRVRHLGEILKKIPDFDQPSYWASQLMRFCYEIKKGDYVVIPSSSSDKLAVGIVEDSNVFIQEKLNFVDIPCNFYKRKKVKWHGTFYRGGEAPQLYPLFASRHAITDANAYSNFILNSTYDLYKRHNELHAIFHVRTLERISLWDYGFYFDAAYLTQAYYDENNLNGDFHTIDLKSSVQSPGIFEFISQNINLLWVFSVLVILVNGGD
jgi:restriction system protein